MTLPALNVNRDQLAQFLPDHETIRQFETLFQVAEDVQSTPVQDALILAGNADAKANTALNALYWSKSGTSLFPKNLSNKLSIGSTSSVAQVNIEPTTASTKGLIIKGAVSQTENLLDFQDDVGTILGETNSDGLVGIGGVVDPSGDYDLTVNGLTRHNSLYSDQTGAGFYDVTGAGGANAVWICSQLDIYNSTITTGFQAVGGLHLLQANTTNIGHIGLAGQVSCMGASTATHYGSVGVAQHSIPSGDTVEMIAGTGSYSVITDTGTLTNLVRFYGATPLDYTGGSSTITNNYGLLLEDLTLGTNNYAIKTGLGMVDIGDGVAINGSQDIVQLSVKGSAGQTDNLTEWKDSSSTVLSVVDKDGKIGIATSSPSSVLNIFGTGASKEGGIIIDREAGFLGRYHIGCASYQATNTRDFTIGYNSSILRITSKGSGIRIIEKNSQTLSLWTNDTERVSITGAGLVGIGTSSPSSTLTVNGDSLFNSGSGDNDFTIYSDTGVSYKFDNGLKTHDFTGITTMNDQLILESSTTTEASLKFIVGSGPTVPESGEMWYEDNHLAFVSIADTRVVTLGNGTIISDTTVANTVTETTIYTEPISANEFHAHQLVKCRVLGRFSTANASDSFTARIKVGGTTIGTINSVSKNVTDVGFDIDFFFTIRSVGVTGTVFSHSTAIFDELAITDASTSTVTIDTTTSNNITVTIEWDSADADNTVTVSQAYSEFIG